MDLEVRLQNGVVDTFRGQQRDTNAVSSWAISYDAKADESEGLIVLRTRTYWTYEIEYHQWRHEPEERSQAGYYRPSQWASFRLV